MTDHFIKKICRVFNRLGCRGSLTGLAVRGEDLLASGIPAGPAVGICLSRLLDAVIEGQLPNHRESLLDWVRGQS